MLLTLSTLAALSAAQCGATTFSVDLGNTYCPNVRKQESIKTADDCMKTCCTQGDDKCTTWQWCEPGAACASGFNAQPGALSRGSDLDVRHTPRFHPWSLCTRDPIHPTHSLGHTMIVCFHISRV